MKFKYKNLGLLSGNVSEIVLLDSDAFAMGVNPGDRMIIHHVDEDGKIYGEGVIVSVDVATGKGIVKPGEVGLYDETVEKLKLKTTEKFVDITLSSKPKSFEYIKKKIKGQTLSNQEINAIIDDCTNGNLTPIEMTALIVALEIRGANDEEVVDFTNAMANSGEVLKFEETVYDKHSTGGVPGNKVTLIIVPIVAAAGLFIPKTSTRAITSPSGTADSFEALAPVTFSREKMLEILKTERAGILWGGAIDSAPADNALINVEKPLNMDPFPLMIASIICKKKAMGVSKLVLDIPCGKGTKFPTTDDGRKFALRFKEIAKRVGIDAICMLTSAEQPIGHAVGPALEAREALALLYDVKNGPSSLINKSTELAGILLEMAGKVPEGKGKDMALDILKSGKALQAMKRIIKAQGGNPDIKPEQVEVGPYIAEIKSTKDGFITNVDNSVINRIAKIAGCPAIKKAGIEIIKKIGAKVSEGDIIFKIYSDNEKRLAEAVEYYNVHPAQELGGMTIEKI